MSNVNVSSAKTELIQAAKVLASSGLLFRGEHANLSARVGENKVVITRGGSIANLGDDSFAVVTLEGAVVEGELDSVTNEVVEMHTAVYRVRDSVGSVMHVHAPHATVFAVAHQEIPLIYEPLVRFGITESIPVVPWAPRGSEESVSGIVQIVRKHPGLPAVLLANHGVLAFSSSPMQTARLLATLDEAAELALGAQALGGAKTLPKQAYTQVEARMRAFGSTM
ncbi:class II aldolase/adducin family protein [Alicyclobacillus sp.]|uniref:class II aldolase/adducin family protein n=1 Tax=Alicyclobacillus sp. TaxID=61169 RepID=UPI0025C6F2D0|nr:class II aldolase/adducin family protein [Alicyclobacillus sp.]MCL6517879.1 class II aldolase/adducin family protein [Alicyclobacillus sp.]